MFSNLQLPSTKVVVSAAASAAATAMVVRSFAANYLPYEFRQYFFTKLHHFLAALSKEITFVIEEFDGLNNNNLFSAAELYVGAIANRCTKIYRASLVENGKKIDVSNGGGEEVIDNFRGVRLKWRLFTKPMQPRSVRYPDGYTSTELSEVRNWQLRFQKKHKNRVVNEYLPYVLERSKALNEERKSLKLHCLVNDHGPRITPWQYVNLDHPSKFETLAMDDEMKNMIIDDLDRFLKRKEFYRKVGKAWKRGYLLFGPPGTGKSSLIAAIANYLSFDVYDLELSDIRSDSELKRLLISTANRSILVVEDFDASIDLSEMRSREAALYPYTQQNSKVTLSGLLNFIDGLWSSIGDERIIIFTTNHIEKLDPALLRPGRMDMHINMSYCTPCGFRLLANNYLGMTEHELLVQAEELIASSKVTPAEIGEQLLKCDEPEVALEGLIEFLKVKREAEREMERSQLYQANGVDSFPEWTEMAEAFPENIMQEMLNKEETLNAVKFLIGSSTAATASSSSSDASSSGKEKGIMIGNSDASSSGKQKGIVIGNSDASSSGKQKGIVIGNSDASSSGKQKGIVIGNPDASSSGKQKGIVIANSDASSSGKQKGIVIGGN